ncbi:microtubule nucleation factor SSNA1 isoform X1 [Eretmochelys imbricata]
MVPRGMPSPRRVLAGWAPCTMWGRRKVKGLGCPAPPVSQEDVPRPRHMPEVGKKEGIEELCTKRDELSHQIQQEEGEKNKLQNDIRLLTEKLARVNESLARKMATRNEFEKTIAETEAAYTKILESSQTLLNVLKKEAGNLSRATELKSSITKES